MLNLFLARLMPCACAWKKRRQLWIRRASRYKKCQKRREHSMEKFMTSKTCWRLKSAKLTCCRKRWLRGILCWVEKCIRYVKTHVATLHFDSWLLEFPLQIENLQEQLRDKEKQMSSLKERVKSLQADTSNTDTALTTLEESLSEKVNYQWLAH